MRIYLRDTEEWCSWEPETRAVMVMLMRKAERTGAVRFASRKGLAAMLRTRLEWVEIALPELLVPGGPLTAIDGGVLVRNYVAAQDCPQTDKLRQAEHRARVRAAMLESRNVTESHDRSHGVTACHSVPSVPCLSVPSGESAERGASPPGVSEKNGKKKANGQREVALDVWGHYLAWRKQAGLVTRKEPTAKNLGLIMAHLGTWSPEQLKLAIQNMLQNPFNLGVNDRNGKFVLLENAIRTDEIIQRHLDNPPRK